MKTILLAAAAVAALVMPALAGEGNGEPFPLYSDGMNTAVALRRADTGSAAYPSIVGRPGSELSLRAAGVVPSTGSEQPVQTANSLPRGFERSLPVYAQRLPVRSKAPVQNSIYLSHG